MEFPWNRKEKIRQLESKIDELEAQIDELKEEKESYKQRYKAEKERRSDLAAKKQEAEKELKNLRQKKEENTKSQQDEQVQSRNTAQSISLERTRRILNKINSYESPEEELVTVYSPQDLQEISDLKGLKNSVSKQEYDFLSDESFIAFIEPDLIRVKLKSRPFFSPLWKTEQTFSIDQVQDFISKEKQWAVVSAGETKIISEKDGEIVSKEEVSTRIEKQQKKGGFSQGRFERKRDEQIQEHLKQVEEKVTQETLLIGDERLCKKLPGEYLGGFDDKKNLVDTLYAFQLERMEEV